MVKSRADKNTEVILKQQLTELQKLRDTLPLDQIKAAEDRVLAQSLDILEGLMDFSVLGFDSEGKVDENSIPFEWRLLSDQEKARKIRLARFGALSSADIPHGAKLAHATAMGIIKARAHEKSGPKTLNLEVSTFPTLAPLEPAKESIDAEFAVIDVE